MCYVVFCLLKSCRRKLCKCRFKKLVIINTTYSCVQHIFTLSTCALSSLVWTCNPCKRENPCSLRIACGMMAFQEGKYLVVGDSFVRRLDAFQWRVYHQRLCVNGRRVDMEGYSRATVGKVDEIVRRMGPVRLRSYSVVVLSVGGSDLCAGWSPPSRWHPSQ